jgi:hypothetical protein
VAEGIKPSEVEEPGLGAIVIFDYGFKNGCALRTGMYVHTAAGWSMHPDGRLPVTWKRLMNLKRLNAKLRADNPLSDVVHGIRVTVLAYSPAELLDSLMEESRG